MTSLHKNQVKFNSNITISHTGGQLSSDSGLVLVKELMNIFGFSELAKQHIHIEDERAYFTHDNLSILEQFIMQLIENKRRHSTQQTKYEILCLKLF
ncbi:hypothetical protein EfmAA96_04190 [Enterococcus faecium]|nr:hypothetical protein EfmAA96_04190 [Enterococcus faecium]